MPRLLAYAVVWWVLTGGDPGSWIWGLPAVAAAALFNPFPAGRRLRFRPITLLRFLHVFLWWSLRGAVDVGLRALGPLERLSPTVVDYPWTLQSTSARTFLANLINLMPGTLCVRITDPSMTVHVIGDTERTLAGLAHLEFLVGQLLETAAHD